MERGSNTTYTLSDVSFKLKPTKNDPKIGHYSFGLIVVMTNGRLIDHGVQQNWANMHKDREDICTFLKDTLDNIYHVFVYNFEEFETHINAQLIGKQICSDLVA